MTESAYEWGLRHHSCEPALEQRKALGPDKTQADWWRICDRGDWLIWQLRRLPPDRFEGIRPKLMRAIEVIVTSAVVESALDCGVPEVELWAARWLSGEDRSADAARAAAERAAAAWEESAYAADAAARAAAWAARAAWAAAAERAAVAAAERAAVAAAERAAWEGIETELRMQANYIRAEIPEWPG